jgi:hypothetical protein
MGRAGSTKRDGCIAGVREVGQGSGLAGAGDGGHAGHVGQGSGGGGLSKAPRSFAAARADS